MRAPLPWLLLALLLTAVGLWQADRQSLQKTQALQSSALDHDGDLPEHHLLQVTLGNQPHCPQLTWLAERWFTIRHGDGHLENRPGRSAQHFKNQLQKQLREYPQCPVQHWVVYGRFTPQTFHFTLP